MKIQKDMNKDFIMLIHEHSLVLYARPFCSCVENNTDLENRLHPLDVLADIVMGKDNFLKFKPHIRIGQLAQLMEVRVYLSPDIQATLVV